MNNEKNLVNEQVTHNTFGVGIVVEQNENYLFVRFDSEEDIKKFQFPNAIANGILTARDEVLTYAKEEAHIRAEKEAKEETQRRAQQNSESQNMREQQREQRQRHAATPQRKNIAFKCNYCDGGVSINHIGFAGVCSENNMSYNIKVKHYSQCEDKKTSKCAAFLRGECTYDEVVSSCDVCYESKMLTTWKAEAGFNLSDGDRQGQARSIRNAQIDSLAVLTTCLPETNEKDRVVFAVFIVDQEIEGDEAEAGLVQANVDGWKIKLSLDEASQIKFWNYCASRSGNPLWGRGLFHYNITDDQAIQILRDIIEVKTNAEEKEYAKEFLNEYCRRIGVSDPSSIPPKHGALLS